MSSRNEQSTGKARRTRNWSQKAQRFGGESLDAKVFQFKTDGGEILITRRHLLYGAGALAGMAVLGEGAKVVNKIASGTQDVDILNVPENAVISSEELEELSPDSCVECIGSYEFPYGTLVWANNSSIAALLIPTGMSHPLTRVAIMHLENGEYWTMLKSAVGSDEGFEIYDVRASIVGIIWTEANILSGVWRVYAAPVIKDELQTPILLHEGDSEWEMPMLATVGSYAFWQVVPNLSGSHTTDDSVLLRIAYGAPASTVEIAYTSHGRFACPPSVTKDSIIIAPRAQTSTVHYQLTKMDVGTLEVQDTMVMPQSMVPLDIGYGNNGFSFIFDAIYNYGGGIANLGTYTPAVPVKDGRYSNVEWFRFARTPACAPAWCGKYLMVKSKSAVCGVDLTTNTYFALPVRDGSDTWGTMLASTGSQRKLVTYASVDDKPVNDDRYTCCLIRVYEPLQDEEEEPEKQDETLTVDPSTIVA